MTIYQILFVQTTKEQAKKLETNYKEVCSFICLVIRALSYFQSTALYCVSENNVFKSATMNLEFMRMRARTDEAVIMSDLRFRIRTKATWGKL